MLTPLLRLGPLAALGVVSAGVNWVAFLRPFPLEQWWQFARLDYAWLTQYELSGQLRFVGAFVVLFALYLWALARLRAEPAGGPLALILLGQVVIGLPLLGIYPVAALDLYDYLLYGRLGRYWGANPLAEPPSRYPGEPLLAYSYWPNEPSVYGPLWQLVSEWTTAAVEGRLPDGLIAFKIVSVAAAVGTTVLIWLTLRRLAPALAPAGALLYGWNPLQQFESAGNGHNDTVMVLFLALAVLLTTRSRLVFTLPALTLGLLTKITLAPLAPLWALVPLLWPGRWSWRLAVAGAGLALSAGLAIALYLPFWRGRASLPWLERGNWFTASPPTLLRELFRRQMEFDEAGRLASLVSALLFALVTAWLAARLARRLARGGSQHPAAAVIRTAYQVFFAYLVLACLWWQPWYLLVLLQLAATSGDRLLAERANLFCFGGLCSYPVFKYIWAVHQVDWRLDYTSIMALSVAVIFTLPLVHLALTARRVAAAT